MPLGDTVETGICLCSLGVDSPRFVSQLPSSMKIAASILSQQDPSPPPAPSYCKLPNYNSSPSSISTSPILNTACSKSPTPPTPVCHSHLPPPPQNFPLVSLEWDCDTAMHARCCTGWGGSDQGSNLTDICSSIMPARAILPHTFTNSAGGTIGSPGGFLSHNGSALSPTHPPSHPFIHFWPFPLTGHNVHAAFSVIETSHWENLFSFLFFGGVLCDQANHSSVSKWSYGHVKHWTDKMLRTHINYQRTVMWILLSDKFCHPDPIIHRQSSAARQSSPRNIQDWSHCWKELMRQTVDWRWKT